MYIDMPIGHLSCYTYNETVCMIAINMFRILVKCLKYINIKMYDNNLILAKQTRFDVKRFSSPWTLFLITF